MKMKLTMFAAGAQLRNFINYLHWPSWLMLWASLALLRFELLREMNLSFSAAWRQGLGLGLHADLVVGLIPVVLASILAWLTGLPRLPGFVVASAMIWTATWSNMMYYSHFGMPLDWWVLEFHIVDVPDVSGFIVELSWSWGVVLSILLGLAGWGAFGWSERKRARRAASSRDAADSRSRPARFPALGALATRAFWLLRLKAVPVSVGLVLAFFVLQQSPRLFHIYGFANPLNSHILQVWYQQKLKSSPYSGVGKEVADEFGRRSQADFGGNPADVLAQYRDFSETKPPAPHAAQNGGTDPASQGGDKPNAWPLLRRFDPDPARTQALRRRLGLPEAGPVNVVLLMVEGLRTYDVLDGEIGPRVFPRLRSVFEKNALLFSQGYSSSIAAGQTVRGSFTTLCSSLPNMAGPATYLAYPTVRVRCLPELLKENGYVTLWFNSHRANSHNKKFFEGSNGMDHFYDKTFFRAKGVTERIGEWGLGDNPVLRETLKEMLVWADKGQGPLFVQILTVSTHGPVKVVPGIRFDEAFERAVAVRPVYRDFMTMFRYTDDAVGNFLDGLFASPIGDNTVVLLLGDHAHTEVPHHALTPVQRMDIPFRTPIAVISKNMRRPEVFGRVVHQVDVAPTAALIAGVRGDVTWVGRGLFAPGGEGSPAIYSSATTFFWRTGTRGCYNEQCFDLREADPSTDKELVALPPQPELERFFRKVVEANGHAISTNRISPIN